MTFAIENNWTVGELKALFRKTFNTAVRVKHGHHNADDSATLQSIGAVSSGADYDNHTLVGDFERDVLLHCRLVIDVCTPDEWVAALNEMPLLRVQEMPSGMTVGKMQQFLMANEEEQEETLLEEETPLAEEEPAQPVAEVQTSAPQQTEPSPAAPPTKRAKGLPQDYQVSKEAIEAYAQQWNDLPDYVAQEGALHKLFTQMCPESTDIQDVLLKISVLNDFYSTNIYDVYSVAVHYINNISDLDRRIREADPTVVDEMAAVPLRDGKIIHHYSFATKYCSHHNPPEYPIYDRYVRDVLLFFKRRDRFAEFSADDLKSFPRFKQVVDDFRHHYGLTQYNFKQIDNYLWQLGKDYYNPYKK